MKLFEAADRYIRTSDWKIIAVLKFCLISLGMMIGMQIRPEHKKDVFLGAAGVFYAEPISNVVCGLICFATMYITVYRKLGTGEMRPV